MNEEIERVLLVGPAGARRDADREILQRAGAQVVCVPSLEEFSAGPGEERFDLVVVDIPEDPGEAIRQCELARALPQAKGAAVVLLTGYEYSSDSRWLAREQARPDVCVHRAAFASLLGAAA